MRNNHLVIKTSSREFSILPLINVLILVLLLFTAPRKNFDSSITYFGIDRLGDDVLAMFMLLSLCLYTIIKTDSNKTFFNQISVLIFTASVTIVYLFSDWTQVNPIYMYGLIVVFILFLMNIYLQGFKLKNFKRIDNKTAQISSAVNLFLTLLLLAFWALPFTKTTLEMFGGGTWANSDKSILVRECCSLADMGTYNLISESMMYSLLIILLVLQISGFTVPVFAIVVSLFSALLSIIRNFSLVSSGPYKPPANSQWTQELLDKYRPTETISPTLAFYLFAFITSLILLNVAISYILNSSKSNLT